MKVVLGSIGAALAGLAVWMAVRFIGRNVPLPGDQDIPALAMMNLVTMQTRVLELILSAVILACGIILISTACVIHRLDAARPSD